MCTYLVTGAAGFIGSRVTEMLVNDGHTVYGVDNLNDAYPVKMKQWRLDRLRQKANGSFQFSQIDVSDHDSLNELWQQAPAFSAVIHLAARTGVRQSVEDPGAYYRSNVDGTLHLLQLSKAHRVNKFVLASTSSLYGAHNQTPYAEDADTSRPVSPYAATKKAAETLAYSYHHLHGLDITVLRYFTVFGPAGRPDMSAFRFVQGIAEGRPIWVYGDGRQSRDFTYVDDIVRGTIAGLKPIGFGTINLGSDQPVVLLDFLKAIEDRLGKKAEIRHADAHPADVRTTWADIGRARTCLSWEPTVDYGEGLSRLVEWYLDNREWASKIHTT